MDRSIAAANFALWVSALQTRNPTIIAALYDEELTLLPTLASRTITDSAGCHKYFIFFCSLHPTVEIMEEYVTQLSDESYLHAGVYRFELGSEGKRESIDARFSFVWKRAGEKWKIVHHHSSRVPVM